MNAVPALPRHTALLLAACLLAACSKINAENYAKIRIGIARGIEVGHVFQLGQKYAQAMGATVLDDMIE